MGAGVVQIRRRNSEIDRLDSYMILAGEPVRVKISQKERKELNADKKPGGP